MYCGQCGKKILENMLFCPFCGAPVVVPEQPEPGRPEPQSPEARPKQVRMDDSTQFEARPAKPPMPEMPEDGSHSPEPRRAAERDEARPTDAHSPESRREEGAETGVRSVQIQTAGPDAVRREEFHSAAPQDGLQRPRSDVRVGDGAVSGGREASRPVSLFDDISAVEEPARESEDFVPLRFDFDAEEDCAAAEPKAAPVEIVPADAAERDSHADAEYRPPRRPAPQEIRRPESARKRAAQTYIPVKDIDLDDMFMDGADRQDDVDEYDLDDDAPARGRYSEEFDFEEPERGSFLQRHIRGIVGMVLLLVLLIICAVWAFSSKGQLALARANLAWTAQPYADLGYEAYRQDSDLLAARYYEKALDRDGTNYEYAHSAMVAYYEADEIESAAAMLKKCIAMNPDSAEPYQEMLILYPDAETRPWEIKELIRQGYERTGNAALNQN